MNLGQFLTDKSPLPSGTVAEHLAAIYAQAGDGPGETVFASSFSVCADDRSIAVTRCGGEQSVFVGVSRQDIGQGDGCISILLPTTSIHCKSSVDQLWILDQQIRTVVQTKFEKSELKINH